MSTDISFSSGKIEAPRQQLVRFVAVGATTAALDYLILYLLVTQWSQGYLLSAAFGFMIGSICNYLLSLRWVFVGGKFRRELEFTFFVIASVIGLSLNQASMWFLIDTQHLNYLFAKGITIVLVTVGNYTMKKRLVFFA